jgi:hypothetical protein
METVQRVLKIQYVYLLKKYIKCGFWRVAVCPSYIEDARFLKVNLLKPTGYGMHQQVEHFNNFTLCPYCIYVFCICLRTNSNLCHIS